jgi:hypothetical protein
MTGESSVASKAAYDTDAAISKDYYDVALPALKTRMNAASTALNRGGSTLMSSAFTAERAGLTEGITSNLADKQAATSRASKSALSGGNAYSTMHPADIGATLANALWGSKFKEGQADIEQRLGLMSTIMGGSASAGNAGLSAAGNELGAISLLPKYNQNYANIMGAASIGASLYGGLNQAGVFNATPPPAGAGGGSMTPPWAQPLA